MPVLPALSVALYLSVYVPAAPVLTDPSTLIVLDISSSQLSIALAPGSLKLEFTITYTVSLPSKVTTGASLSSLIYFLVTFPLLPLLSLTV